MHIRAQQAYQNASTESFAMRINTFQSARQAARTGQSEATGLSAMPKARVTSREIDFSMGKFGLRYTSRNVAFDPEDIQGMQDRRQQFDKELNHAREMDVLRTRTTAFTPPSDAAPGEGATMRQGILKYAHNASPQSYAPPLQRQLLATV